MLTDYQPVYFCLLCLIYALIIILCEFLHSKKGVDAEYTRKLAHTLSALSGLLFLILFTLHWYVLALGILSFLLLFLGYKRQSFQSIEAVNRKTHGSYLLPVSICLIYYISIFYSNKILFILPILILAISDSLACILGRHWTSKELKPQKTLIGSGVFFLSAFLISFFILLPGTKGIWSIALISLGISLVASVAEFVSPKGMDNMTIPFSVVLSLLVFG